jgi:hypothetical protein
MRGKPFAFGEALALPEKRDRRTERVFPTLSRIFRVQSYGRVRLAATW